MHWTGAGSCRHTAGACICRLATLQVLQPLCLESTTEPNKGLAAAITSSLPYVRDDTLQRPPQRFTALILQEARHSCGALPVESWDR